MNKKSNYLIIALIFIILAMGWQLYIRTQPTEKEQKEAQKEAEKIPDQEGIKITINSSATHPQTGLFIGVDGIYSGFASCNFTFPNGTQDSEDMEVGKGFCFWSKKGKSYILRLVRINNDDYRNKYVIFDVQEGEGLDHPYYEQKKQESVGLEPIPYFEPNNEPSNEGLQAAPDTFDYDRSKSKRKILKRD